MDSKEICTKVNSYIGYNRYSVNQVEKVLKKQKQTEHHLYLKSLVDMAKNDLYGIRKQPKLSDKLDEASKGKIGTSRERIDAIVKKHEILYDNYCESKGSICYANYDTPYSLFPQRSKKFS